MPNPDLTLAEATRDDIFHELQHRHNCAILITYNRVRHPDDFPDPNGSGLLISYPDTSSPATIRAILSEVTVVMNSIFPPAPPESSP